ncbi:MAG: DUF2063 domain-containing protein [Porticoccaceae bacterium]|nr:MAG: DUF2063 domain-containing protein [Porticoccaceae bacterium]
MNFAAFARALLHPDLPPPEGLTAWNGSNVAKRFAVYRNNVWHALLEALADTFPLVRRALGDEHFLPLAHRYLCSHPPRSPVLARWGGAFPALLAALEDEDLPPWIADLARLEWACLEALHAPDAPPLAAKALQPLTRDPEGLARSRWRPHPALRLVRSRHPLVALHRALTEEASPPAVAGGENALVVRPRLAVRVVAVDDACAALAAALLGGATLAEATAGSGCEAQLAEALTPLLRHGAFVALTISPEEKP